MCEQTHTAHCCKRVVVVIARIMSDTMSMAAMRQRTATSPVTPQRNGYTSTSSVNGNGNGYGSGSGSGNGVSHGEMSSPTYERRTAFSFGDDEPWPAMSPSAATTPAVAALMNGNGGHTKTDAPTHAHDTADDDDRLPPRDDETQPWKLRLVTYDQLLPKWRRDNEFIRGGYIQNAGTLATLHCSTCVF